MDMEKVIKGLEGMIDYFFDIYRNDTDSYKCAKVQEYSDCAIDAIALLKKQEAKRGHWIDSAGDDKCSVCGATYSDLYPDYQHTHYCPNCGAKMEGL